MIFFLIGFFFLYSKACDNGLHGADCNEVCGQCRNESTCVHTNGTCLTECDAGYEGDMCKTRTYTFIMYILKKIYFLFI